MSDAELFSEECARDPYPFYERWRTESPVWWSDRLAGYVLARHADVRGAFAHPERFRQSQRFQTGLINATRPEIMAALDPPRHTAIRSSFSAPFRPAVLEQHLRAIVERAVDEQLSTVTPGEPFDLNQLTTQLAMAAMSSLMGSEDAPELRDLYVTIIDALRRIRMDQADGSEIEVGARAGRELRERILETRHRGARGEGLNLIAEVAESADMDEEVLAANCAHVLVAGVETTVGAIATTVYALLTHPEELAAVRADPRRVRRAFDEGMRWVSPVQIMGRRVDEPVTVSGVDLEPGDEVFLLLGSANRDPEAYERPDEYVVERRRRDHLAFGSGIHLCLGAPLSRLEGVVMLTRLLERMPALDFDRGRPLPPFLGAPSARALPELWLTEA